MEWKGRPIEDLETCRDITLAHRPGKPIIFEIEHVRYDDIQLSVLDVGE